MSKLAALLGGMTLNDLAKEVLQLQGRRGDTELAHINKREAALLKDMGGSGTINPNTDMPEFYIDYPDMGGVDYGESYGNVTNQPLDYSYMSTPDYDFGYGQTPTANFGDVGQPTPITSGAPSASPPQEISGFDIGFGPDRFTPDYGPADVRGMPAGDVSRFTGETPAAAPGFGERVRGAVQGAEQLAKQYPTLARTAGAAIGSIPGLVAGRRARQDAAATRAEMERMAAPIRAQGEQLLGAGQRGELTPVQQQQIEAARAATRQDLARRGVTSGTAAQQAENRITELAQRFAQQNIDAGVRLIGAANTFSAQAIRDAYKMNADAASMTQAYFTNLMRAAGALPSPVAQAPAQTGAA